MNLYRPSLRALALSLALVAPHALLSAADEPGFQAIFNGTDLSQWDGNPKFWSVKDGCITGQTTPENPTKGNTFIIWKGGTVADFELRLQFRMVGGNSGIQYRSQVVDQANWVVGGYQADMEAGPTYTGILYEERGRGILAERGQMVWIQPDGKLRVVGLLGKSEDIQAGLKKEDWNDYTVIARGNHLTQVINGRVTMDVVDDQAAKAAKSGILALQLHAGPPMLVQFKNIRLRDLGTTTAPLAGAYGVTAATINGNDLPESDREAVEVVFQGDKYTVEAPGMSDSGTFTLDLSASPARMNFKPSSGPLAGQTVQAIVAINGDTFRICYSESGGCPSTFESPDGSNRILMTLKRKNK